MDCPFHYDHENRLKNLEDDVKEVSYVRFIPRKRFLEMVNLMWPRCVYTIK